MIEINGVRQNVLLIAKIQSLDFERNVDTDFKDWFKGLKTGSYRLCDPVHQNHLNMASKRRNEA